MRLLLRQGLRHHAQRPLATGLTLLGIAAGVALLAAMRLSQGTAERAFDRAVEAVAGRATHTIRGGAEGVPVATLAALTRHFGGRGVAPSVRTIARVPDAERRTVLRVLGIDPFADADVRPWAAAGRGDGGPPVFELATTKGGFVGTQELLERLGTQRGETLAITVGGRPFDAICLGALEVPDDTRAGLDDTLVVDLATAQEWTGRVDRVDRIDVRAADANEDPNTADAELATLLGDAPGADELHVERTGAAGDGLARLTRGFRVNVTALSLLSLLVGAFLVHETMRLSVVARRASFGTLRALGATGRAIGTAVAGEALLLGAVGSAAGAGLGIVAAQALLGPIVRTWNDHYATFALPELSIDPLELLLAFGGGTLVTVLAALTPAVAAARVPPRQVHLQASAPTATAERRRRDTRRHVGAALCVIASIWLLDDVGSAIVRGYVGILLLLTAAVLLTPTLMLFVLRAFAWPLERLAPIVRYAARSTIAAKDHLALPLAAMVLAVASTIGMAVLVQSFRASVDGWLAQVLPADLYVSVPGGVDERRQPLDDRLVDALCAAPDSAAVTTYRRAVLPLDGAAARGLATEVDVVGMDATPAWFAGWPLLEGARTTAVEALARDADDATAGAWISEPLANRGGYRLGDTLRLGSGSRAATLPIVAIHRDYGSERGEVLVGRDWLLRRTEAPVTALGIEVPDGAAEPTLAAAAERLRGLAAATSEQTVLVRSQRELRRSSLEVFDRTFAITGVMRVLCLIVAFFGIYAAFGALQLERAAEVGVLRCLGASRSRVLVVVLGQTALLGACAAVLAAPLGVLVGHLLANVVNRASFGWSLTEVLVPPRALVESTLLAVAAAVLAGIGPAVRFARMRPALALRES
jgi:putative ABC transport system permease protein